MPWADAVELQVPEPARPDYLRWPSMFRPSGPVFGGPHAAIRLSDAAMHINELVTVLMYAWLSRYSRHGCGVESFTYRKVTDVEPTDAWFNAVDIVEAGTFRVADDDAELLKALAQLQAVRADTGIKVEDTPEDRLLRAIRLHNEAHWIWVQREAARPLFVLTMALAFEALYTPEKEKLRRTGDTSAFRMDEEQVKRAVDEDARADLTDAVRDFILSTSFLEQVTESAVQAARSPTEDAKDGFRERLVEAVRSRLVGGSGILAALRNGVLATFADTGMDDITRRQVAKWCNKFYGLRSAIAHGDDIKDGCYRFEGVLWHELIARAVFRAVVFESLVTHKGLSMSVSKRLRNTYTHPALASVVPNRARLRSIAALVSNTRTDPPGDVCSVWGFWDKLHRLLQDIREDDSTCSDADLRDALARLGELPKGLADVPQYVANEVEAAEHRLVIAAEMLNTRAGKDKSRHVRSAG